MRVIWLKLLPDLFSAGSPPVSSHITQSKNQNSTIVCKALLVWCPAWALTTKASHVLEICLYSLHLLFLCLEQSSLRYTHSFHPFLQVFAKCHPSHPYHLLSSFLAYCKVIEFIISYLFLSSTQCHII